MLSRHLCHTALKMYSHYLSGCTRKYRRRQGYFFKPFHFYLPQSGTTRGTSTSQCLFGTKCFQGCTTAGTCKCLLCALLLWDVCFVAASVDGSVYESISVVVVLSLFAAQAGIVALVCVSLSLNECAKTGSALCLCRVPLKTMCPIWYI